MEVLNLHIVANPRQQDLLNRILRPVRHIECIHHGELQDLKTCPISAGSDLCIVWIDDYIGRIRPGILQSTGWIDKKQSIILVGEKLHPSTVLHLRTLGFSRLFCLPDDKENLLDEIIGLLPAVSWPSLVQKDESHLETSLIGKSIPFMALKSQIRKIAPRDRLLVLVRGETGTGKGVVSRLLHQMSPRSANPFIEINCTAIPEALVEAELFGHERGAFTDAHKSRRGIFELSHGGTLFLDEIGHLRPEVQVKLLKVLEDKRFRRVGGEADIQVDCRIIAGTSVNLEEKVARGEFREDLYYRLNVFPITIPPLRERGQDVLRLAEHFRELYSKEHVIRTKGFTEKAIDCLAGSTWHGNVRELKHCIERAVILSEDDFIDEKAVVCTSVECCVKSLVEEAKSVTGESDNGFTIHLHIPESGKSMNEIQKDVISKVLERTGGNRSEAARLLGISRSRLLRRINTEDSID